MSMVNSDRITAYFQTRSTLNRDVTAQKSGALKTGNHPEKGAYEQYAHNNLPEISRQKSEHKKETDHEVLD